MKAFQEFEIKKRGDKWVVLGHKGDVRGTHDTEQEAKDQIKAIYANGYKEASKPETYYLGTCIGIDDNGDNFGFDATEFAQAEDRAIAKDNSLSSEEFWNTHAAPKGLKEFLLDQPDIWYSYDGDLNVSWAYNPDEDVHYIWRGTGLGSYALEEAADRLVSLISFRFPKGVIGYSDIHSQSQLNGSSLNAFGRGVVSSSGEVRIGNIGSSHIGLSKGIPDAKRFYFGYSKDLQTVYVVPKNGMDEDFFKKSDILKMILSNIFDMYRLSITPGKKLIIQEKLMSKSFIRESNSDQKLLDAIVEGDAEEAVKQLLDVGANVHANDDNALRLAVRNGRADIVRLLLDAGADIHIFDDYALRWAAELGYTEIVKLLLKAGADVHAGNNYALRHAAENGHTEIVKLLLDAGADIHARDDLALRWAAENGHTEIVKLLLENGADVHARDDYALHWAADNGHTEIVKLLLDAGADIHARDDYALFLAAYNGHTEIVKLLLDAGADVHVNDDDALHLAAYNGHTEIVKLLLDAGADVHANDDLALRAAAENGHTEIIKLLKAAGSGARELESYLRIVRRAFKEAKKLFNQNFSTEKVRRFLQENYKNLDAEAVEDILIESKSSPLKEMNYNEMMIFKKKVKEYFMNGKFDAKRAAYELGMKGWSFNAAQEIVEGWEQEKVASEIGEDNIEELQ